MGIQIQTLKFDSTSFYLQLHSFFNMGMQRPREGLELFLFIAYIFVFIFSLAYFADSVVGVGFAPPVLGLVVSICGMIGILFRSSILMLIATIGALIVVILYIITVIIIIVDGTVRFGTWGFIRLVVGSSFGSSSQNFPTIFEEPTEFS